MNGTSIDNAMALKPSWVWLHHVIAVRTSDAARVR
jgi:hypothetical protein